MDSKQPEPDDIEGRDPEDAGPSVRDLIFEVLSRSDGDDQTRGTVVEELCVKWPARAEKLRRAVSGLASAGLIEPSEIPSSLGGLRILRRLGGGGMGVVLLAEQPSLGRRVAVKLLRTDELFREGARERFQRETEAVARLAHPNVVAVHSVGSQGGVPYLVMDLVRGASLDRIVSANADRPPAELSGADFYAALLGALDEEDHADIDSTAEQPALFRGSWIDVCLRVTRDVAAALEHAHVRGVLHRDIKPSNVMVTAEGRVQLVDFGLAAVLDAERLTKTGALMGSLPYLAPEQLGAAPEPDARGDVYSLGVTLYELLILGLPFPGRGTQRLRADIEEGRLLSARGQNSAIGPELETVLRCACQRSAAARYGSAAEFAIDLTNLLKGRPIVARPARALTRAAHWVRRRPAETALACALSVIVVGGPIAYGLQQRSHGAEMLDANERLSASLALETKARERADAHFERAASAIDDVARRLATDGLENEPRMQKARLQIIHKSVDMLGELLQERPKDANMLERYGRALGLRAGLLREQGQVEEGLKDNQECIEIQVRLVAERPSDQMLRLDLGTMRIGLANSLQYVYRADEAVNVLEEAVVPLEALTLEEPTNQRYAYSYSNALNTLAATLYRAERLDESEEATINARRIADAHVDRWPDEHRFLSLQAQGLRAPGHLAKARGDFREAARLYGRAREIAERALTLKPGDRFYQVLIVESAQNSARSLISAEAIDEAVAALQPAQFHLRDLLSRYPSVKTGLHLQIEGLCIAASLASMQGAAERAIELSEEALAAELKIQETYGVTLSDVLGEVAGRTYLASRLSAAEVLGEDRFDRAIKECRRAIALLDEHDPSEGADPHFLFDAWSEFLVALIGQGGPESEVNIAIEKLNSTTLEQPGDLYSLAVAWSGVAAYRARTGEDGAGERAAWEATLEVLSRAAAGGYADRAALESAEAFLGLQDDPRFRALVDGMPGD